MIAAGAQGVTGTECGDRGAQQGPARGPPRIAERLRAVIGDA